VAGMLGRLFERGLWVIRLLVIGPAGDLVVFQPQMAADAALVQVGPKVFIIEIEADVAVEVAVVVIPGIAVHGAPNWLGGLRIPGQGSDMRLRATQRCIDAELRPGLREQYRVGIRKEVANSRV